VKHDDRPPLARRLQQVDEALGEGERVVLALLFLVLLYFGVYRALANIFWNQRPLWAVEGIRVSVFALAMMGAAFATHHKRNFALDILSRLFAVRGRAILRVVLNAATVLAAALLFYGGWLVKEVISREHDYELVPKWVIGWFIPVAAALILVHCLLHTIIELAYLARGETAPEPEQVVG
jgi:TRAP-type C4-dicarboxylate transport system permease small subunit